MKKTSMAVCAFLLCVFGQHYMVSNALAAEEKAPLDGSQKAYLRTLTQKENMEALGNFLDTFSEKYTYVTATGSGIKIRKGPGTHYEAEKLRLHKGANPNQATGIVYADYLYGLIVAHETILGNEECSAWQEVIAVHTAWDSEERFMDGSGSFDDATPQYVCKDFIAPHPTKAMPGFSDFANLFDHYLLNVFHVRGESYGLTAPLKVHKAIPLFATQEFKDKGYELTEKDIVGFTLPGVYDSKKIVTVYLYIDSEKSKYGTVVGYLPFEGIENVFMLDDATKQEIETLKARFKN